jgi:hypothetical protein
MSAMVAVIVVNIGQTTDKQRLDILLTGCADVCSTHSLLLLTAELQVGGNVLTSQRVTDVVLRAFLAAAASSGCMNNLTFGDEGLG